MKRPPPVAPRTGLPSEVIAAAALVIGVVVLQSIALIPLRRLPDPLLGGDLHYQMGCVRSIRASLDPFASCSTSGAMPGYLPLYGTLIALFSLPFGLDALPAMLIMGALLKAASVLIVAWVCARLLGPLPGLVMAALGYALRPDPILRYTEFTSGVIVPLYFLALCLFLQDKTLRRAVFLGLVIAVAGYSHAVAFIGGVIVFVGSLLLDLIVRREPAARGPAPALLRNVGFVVLVASLSLGYWWKPLFVHHGRTSAHYTEWNGGPSLASLPLRWEHARETLSSLVSFATPAGALASLLFLIGATLLLFHSAARRRFASIGIAAAATLTFSFHDFVTEPLFHFNLIPDYVVAMLLAFARILVAAVGLTVLLEKLRPGNARVAAYALAMALVALGTFETLRLASSDAFLRAREPAHPMYVSLQRWVYGNTAPSDVVLSTNELSFALSALTGRKVMVTRRAQNDAFIDMDVRNRDAALILYGRDPTLRRELLGKYSVDYVLWTDEWVSTEFYVDGQGEVRGYDDPLLYFENPGYDAELARAGVDIVHQTGWVDPTLRGERNRKFPLTIVSPRNYSRPDQPWQPDLDPDLSEVWRYDEGGHHIAALYRVRTPLQGMKPASPP